MRVYLFVISLVPGALLAVVAAFSVMRWVDSFLVLTDEISFAGFVAIMSLFFGTFFGLCFKIFGLRVRKVGGRLEVVEEGTGASGEPEDG
ncbi:hypothetical protein L6Q96_23055 [Candidatus Binatia bacterium]|nr:hypothetical protein [Candidatus Binatia bacterium]